MSLLTAILPPLNPPMVDWSDKTVWIVGASSGIGEATAAALHARGARVVVSARKAQALAAFVETHPGSRALALDVTQRGAVQAAAAELLAQGPLDCVVYCAGHYHAMRADARTFWGTLCRARHLSRPSWPSSTRLAESQLRENGRMR